MIINRTIKNPEFVKRMVVDAENIADIRKKFFNGEKITPEEIENTISATPRHKNINWGLDRLSMIPWASLEHLDKCIKDTVNKNIEGDFVETGAWRGGACIIAKSIYDDLKINKKIFVADSFEGLPKPDAAKYPDDKNDTHFLDENMKVSLETVKKNFKKFGLLDNNVIFLKGWFKDTMPNAPINKISILRLDGDMYESTIDVLKNLYHKLSIGGYCIIDDYRHPGCKAAVRDFRSYNGISERIIKVDKNRLNEVHFWIKEKETSYTNRDYSKRGMARLIRLVKNHTVLTGKKSIRNIIKAINLLNIK